jgi:hypothetical protein
VQDEKSQALAQEAMRTMEGLQAGLLSSRMQIAATITAALITNPQFVFGCQSGETLEQVTARVAFNFTDALIAEAKRRGEMEGGQP